MEETETAPDWTEVFEGPHRAALCDQIRALSVERIQRLPPPKSGPGLPFGREGRILRRFLVGESSMLDPSAFSGAYRSVASAAERSLFEALWLGRPMRPARWSDLVGAEALALWRELDLLESQGDQGLAVRFRVAHAGGTTLLVDPTIQRFDEGWHNRIHIGQDSLNLLEFLAPRVPPDAERIVEVGPGSGLILLSLAPGRREAVGLDINPRAVRVSRLNAEINRRDNVRIEQADIFDPATQPGRYDLAYWNTPLNFLPEEAKEIAVDGYGGHLGIELALAFLRRLPDLLAPGGRGVALALPPVLDDGARPLERELATLAPELGLDVRVHVTQRSWLPHLREFHRRFSIQHFESAFLEVTPGEGRVDRVEPSLSRRAIDLLRGATYAVREARGSS